MTHTYQLTTYQTTPKSGKLITRVAKDKTPPLVKPTYMIQYPMQETHLYTEQHHITGRLNLYDNTPSIMEATEGETLFYPLIIFQQ